MDTDGDRGEDSQHNSVQDLFLISIGARVRCVASLCIWFPILYFAYLNKSSVYNTYIISNPYTCEFI